MKKGWKRLWRALRYLVAPPCLEAMVGLTKFVPWGVARYIFVDVLGGVAWWFAGPWKGRMRENILYCLGRQASREVVDGIARAALRNMFLGFLEVLYSVPSSHRVDGILWRGEDHLKAALGEGKGVIAVTAHIGNFALMGLAMARRGYPFKMIIKDPKHPRMARTFQRMRQRQGTPWIPALPPLKAQREILRALRRREIVGFVADQGMRRGGMVMEFLGVKRAMPTGPAFYHLLTGAPVLPMYLMREGDGLQMVVKPPIEVALTGDREEDLYLITSAVMRELEETIKAHPDQWHWVGRTRPKIRTRRRGPSKEVP